MFKKFTAFLVRESLNSASELISFEAFLSIIDSAESDNRDFLVIIDLKD